MDHQLSFSDSEFINKSSQARKEKFLGRMGKLTPQQRLESVVEPFYPKPENGRKPYPRQTILHIHCMQKCYSMSDPAMEDELYEILSMRLFAGLSLDGTIPDHTTIMNFRHLMKRHDLARKIFKEVSS